MARWLRNTSLSPLFAILLAAALLGACAPAEEAAETEEEPAATEEAEEPAEAPAEPDLYFENIEDGGTYSSPVELRFGVDNFDVVPVEDPMVVREGEGHFHLAVDHECIEPGTILEQGVPSLIHFGDGSSSITMQLEPGEHTLCLQMADGEHRTYEEPLYSQLLEEVTITVEEGDGEEGSDEQS